MEEMDDEMAQWESEKEYVIGRIDRFEDRFDKIDSIITKQGEQIEDIKVEVLRLAFNMNSFKNEFKLKTSAWAFLGTAIALAIAVIVYLVKNQLV
jgi:chromosome segregation ATPase